MASRTLRVRLYTRWMVDDTPIWSSVIGIRSNFVEFKTELLPYVELPLVEHVNPGPEITPSRINSGATPPRFKMSLDLARRSC